MSEPTALDQYLIELINRARLDPAGEAARLGIDLNQGLSQGKINTAPKQPLAFDPALTEFGAGAFQVDARQGCLFTYRGERQRSG